MTFYERSENFSPISCMFVIFTLLYVCFVLFSLAFKTSGRPTSLHENIIGHVLFVKFWLAITMPIFKVISNCKAVTLNLRDQDQDWDQTLETRTMTNILLSRPAKTEILMSRSGQNRDWDWDQTIKNKTKTKSLFLRMCANSVFVMKIVVRGWIAELLQSGKLLTYVSVNLWCTRARQP